jgi:hypothetical protein
MLLGYPINVLTPVVLFILIIGIITGLLPYSFSLFELPLSSFGSHLIMQAAAQREDTPSYTTDQELDGHVSKMDVIAYASGGYAQDLTPDLPQSSNASEVNVSTNQDMENITDIP